MIMCANLTRSRMRRQKAAVSNWASGHAVQIRAVGDTTQYGRCGLQCSCPLSASTMLTRLLRTALPVALGATFGVQTAHADIYTWVDAAGSINVSNLAPPDDVRVTKVMHASASAAATGDEPARDTTRLAEMRALAERVRQLEDEVESARRQVPPPVDSRVVPMPPMVQYVVNPAPALAQYPVVEAPPTNNWCDPTWLGCGLAWGPAFYPASVFVLRAPNFRHFQTVPGRHHVAVHPPMRRPNGVRRG